MWSALVGASLGTGSLEASVPGATYAATSKATGATSSSAAISGVNIYATAWVAGFIAYFTIEAFLLLVQWIPSNTVSRENPGSWLW